MARWNTDCWNLSAFEQGSWKKLFCAWHSSGIDERGMINLVFPCASALSEVKWICATVGKQLLVSLASALQYVIELGCGTDMPGKAHVFCSGYQNGSYGTVILESG